VGDRPGQERDQLWSERATLDEIGVKPEVISTSPIKIACHVATEDVPRAVAALHDAFELETA